MIYLFEAFELDAERGELRHAGKIVEAEAMAVRLLSCLVERQGSLVTKDELIDAVWEGRALADNAITVCVARLRKVLRRHAGEAAFVATVYGQGYRFVQPVTRSTRAGKYSSPPPSANPQTSAPCVGRDRVIERMLRLYDNAVERQGVVCAVMGTGGVGKTRVVEVLERRLASRQRVLWAYCRDSGTAPPLSPWLRLMQSVAVDAWTPELVQALGSYAPALRAWLGLDRSPTSAPDAGADSDIAMDAGTPTTRPGTRNPARRVVFDGILRMLTLVSSTTPLCLVLDDLHRADAASLELLHMLLDEIAHTRILILCTVRQAEGHAVSRPGTDLPAILGHRNCERLLLTRLERADVATYLKARLGEVTPALVDSVMAGSEGLPFFMVELVRQVEAHGIPTEHALTVPVQALELFRGRVARLSEGAQHVLQVASVIGRAFELPLLQDTSGMPAAAVLSGIDEAIAFEIVVAAPGTVSAFAFEHELMRRAIYEAMPVAERRRLHLLVATAMEQRGLVNDQLTHALAYHLHAALPEGDLDKVVHYCQLAAWTAGAAFAYHDAAVHLGHAIEALELKPNAEPQRRALMHLIKAMYSRGQMGSRASLETACRLGYQVGDGALLVRAAFMYNPHPILQPISDSRALLEHALTILPADSDVARASALAGLACTAPGCFDRGTTEARMSEAIALARKTGDSAALYPVGLAELHLQGGPIYGDRRAALRAELIELARAHPDTLPVLPIDVALAHTLDAMQRGQTAEADAALERAARLARAINHREMQWHARRLTAWSTLDRTGASGAVAELVQLHRRAARNEVVDLALFCAFDRCLLALDAGETPYLDETDLLALAYDPSDPVHVWALKLRALLAAGLKMEAQEALRAVAVVRIFALPCDAQALGSLSQLARVAIALNEPEYARAIGLALEPFSDGFGVNIGYRCEGAVAQVLGELAIFLGERERARGLLRQGVDMNERAGLMRCTAEARMALDSL